MSRLDAAILCTQAQAALTGLGWKLAIARDGGCCSGDVGPGGDTGAHLRVAAPPEA